MTNRVRIAAVLLWTPAAAVAQTLPVPIPKALIFPNYDSVLVGQNEALEGGAYIARVDDASANFYNPAGLVAAEKTALNASSTGYVVTRISSEALNTSVTSTKIDNLPGYFGAVIVPPFIDTRNLRLGVSITRGVAWSPGAIDQSTTRSSGVSSLDRITYSTDSSFGTLLYQIACAWAPVANRSLRLGLSAGFSQTSYKNESTISGLLSLGGQPGQFLSTVRASGNEWDAIFGLGAQWDVVGGLTLGMLVWSPGLRFGSSSQITYESSFLRPSAPTNSFFRDENGQFQYRQPWIASLGIAYRFGRAQLEADLRYHDAVGSYEIYRSNVPIQLLVQNPDGTTSTSAQPASTPVYSARRVYNAAIGGNVKVARTITLHAGFYTAFSPVADATTSPLRRADLYGVIGGVDFQLEHFGASVGAGYQFGNSGATGIAVNEQILQANVKIESISVLYAISYQF